MFSSHPLVTLSRRLFLFFGQRICNFSSVDVTKHSCSWRKLVFVKKNISFRHRLWDPHNEPRTGRNISILCLPLKKLKDENFLRLLLLIGNVTNYVNDLHRVGSFSFLGCRFHQVRLPVVSNEKFAGFKRGNFASCCKY